MIPKRILVYIAFIIIVKCISCVTRYRIVTVRRLTHEPKTCIDSCLGFAANKTLRIFFF